MKILFLLLTGIEPSRASSWDASSNKSLLGIYSDEALRSSQHDEQLLQVALHVLRW